MGFGDLRSAGGLSALNAFLADRSYIEGYTASQADVVVYKALSGAPNADLFNALRWFNQVKSYTSTFDSLPGVKKAVTEYGTSGTPAAKAAPAAADADSDDDFDCFGSDDESTPAPPPKKMEAKVTKPKKVVIAKSSILYDVKPCDDETDLGDIEKKVRAIVKDGLNWGASKRVPLCYGIEKLSILCTVEDDKVGVDDLQEEIEEFDEVQSVDIAAFNKI